MSYSALQACGDTEEWGHVLILPGQNEVYVFRFDPTVRVTTADHLNKVIQACGRSKWWGMDVKAAVLADNGSIDVVFKLSASCDVDLPQFQTVAGLCDKLAEDANLAAALPGFAVDRDWSGDYLADSLVVTGPQPVLDFWHKVNTVWSCANGPTAAFGSEGIYAGGTADDGQLLHPVAGPGKPGLGPGGGGPGGGGPGGQPVGAVAASTGTVIVGAALVGLLLWMRRRNRR